MSTTDLMVAALNRMGCRCNEYEQGFKTFSYQGKDFYFKANEDTSWVMMETMPLEYHPIGNGGEVSMLQFALDRVNARQVCRAISIVDFDNGVYSYYMKCDFPIYAFSPNIDRYLGDWLKGFFLLEQDVEITFNSLMNQKM